MTRRSLSVCSVPGCPILTADGKCGPHAAEARAAKDAARPNFRERGYDAEYDRNHAVVLREETHCGLCGRLVDKSLPGTDPDGPSVDHIVPRSRGGSNARENLRLVHARENSGRTRFDGEPAAPQPAARPPRVYRVRSASIR